MGDVHPNQTTQKCIFLLAERKIYSPEVAGPSKYLLWQHQSLARALGGSGARAIINIKMRETPVMSAAPHIFSGFHTRERGADAREERDFLLPTAHLFGFVT